MKTCIALSIAFFCAGCNPFSGFKPDSSALVKSGWARNPKKEPPAPLYCYRTLAETMCYTKPLPNSNERKQGSYEHMESVPDAPPTWKELLKDEWEREFY